MTIGAISEAPPRISERAVGRRKRLNSVTMWTLLVFMALAPLPFGSVYPFSWGLSALVVGLAATAYTVQLSRIGIAPRVTLSEMGPQLVLFGAFCSYLVVQILPIGLVFPGLTAFTVNGITFQSPSLSVTSDQTLLMLIRHLTYGLLFFLVVQITQSPGRRQFFLKAILVVIALYCAYALISLQTGDTILGIAKRSYLGSATGTFINRNSFATFLAIGSVVALAQIGGNIVRQSMRHVHDGTAPGVVGNIVVYGVIYIVLFAVVFATQSRMGTFCAIAGSAIIIAIVLGRISRSVLALTAIVVAVVVASLAAFLFFGESLFERTIDVEASAAQRFEVYRQTIGLILMRPLTGFGGGSFEQIFQFVHKFPVSSELVWNRAHNSYLSLWSEMGLVFGSLPVIALALIGVRLIRALREDSPGWAVQATGLAILVIVAVHSLVDFSLEIQANAIFFVALIATAVGSTYGQAHKRR